MKVLFVASEVAPFRKTGGLGDVAGALPKALHRRGIEVRVVAPLYRGTPRQQLERLDGILRVPMYRGEGRAGVWLGRLPGSDAPIYFLEHDHYFDREHLYGAPSEAYADNLERFTFLCRSSLALCRALGFEPQVVHSHDWQTALLPYYLSTIERSGALGRAATVHTLHNLAHQGSFDAAARFITGLGPEHYHAGALEHFGTLNLTKAAILHSTMVTTVSPTYAEEIQRPELGCGLDGVLASRRADLRGILNGIDAELWNPAADPHLAAPFSAQNLAGKATCKAALQREMGLPVRSDVPLVGLIGRLTYQKGLDVFAAAVPTLLQWDLQFVLLGTGDHDLEATFLSMTERHPTRFRARLVLDDALAHRVEAGCDLFLMPSRFEPCGLNQLYSLRYGTLPIVRATGGLADTVATYDEATGQGTGFVFQDLDARSLVNSVGWALSTYHDRPHHFRALQRRAMAQDFSWERAERDYEALYREASDRAARRPS